LDGFFCGRGALIRVSFTSLLVFSVIFLFNGQGFTAAQEGGWNRSCVTSIQQRVVEGDSMAGIFKNGGSLKALIGFYDCNPVERGDAVIYDYAGSVIPLVKTVKAVPGDSFRLEATNGGWLVYVNGIELKNSQQKPYLLDRQGYEMLSLYEKTYNSRIPEHMFLLLGNIPRGSFDSTKFGLAHEEDIIGRAVPI
jgi:signal peptidase I